MQEIYTIQPQQRLSTTSVTKDCLGKALACTPFNALSKLSEGSGSQAATSSFTSSTVLETPAKYKRFRHPPKAYRRYDYTRRHAIRLAKRCSTIKPDCNFPDFGDVDIYLIQLDNEMAIDEFQLALPDVTIVEEATCNSFKELLSQIARNNKELWVVVTPRQNYKLCQSVLSDKEMSIKVVFDVKNTGIAIGKLLERNVLRHLNNIFTAMGDYLETLPKTIANSIEAGNLPQIQTSDYYIVEHQTDDNSHPGFDNEKNFTEVGTQSDGDVQSKSHNHNNGVVSVGCVNSKRDEVIQLRREIMGMFKRSGVPPCEYPLQCEDTCDKKLGEELERYLTDEENVIAYGFRFAKLNIIVKSKYITNVGEMVEQLKKNNITEFVIREHSDVGFCDITTGSCIRHDKSERQGTLGGFVQWRREDEKNKIMCAITAKHVVLGASKLICVSGTTEREIGTVLQQTDPLDVIGLDISAVEIRKEFVDICEKKFKDMEGQLFYGELYDLDCNAEKSEGLPVYIWGAKSGLGKGILSFQQLKKIDDYLYIEDMEDNNHFCQKGDSGSVVCADLPDDYVQSVKVLAILSGQKVKSGDTGYKEEYGAVKLIRGLQELGKRCTGGFELYNDKSDLNPYHSNH